MTAIRNLHDDLRNGRTGFSGAQLRAGFALTLLGTSRCVLPIPNARERHGFRKYSRASQRLRTGSGWRGNVGTYQRMNRRHGRNEYASAGRHRLFDIRSPNLGMSRWHERVPALQGCVALHVRVRPGLSTGRWPPACGYIDKEIRPSVRRFLDRSLRRSGRRGAPSCTARIEWPAGRRSERSRERTLPLSRGLRTAKSPHRSIFVNTVKTHLKDLYRKLGASNRAQAVASAAEAGLLARRPVAVSARAG